MNMPGMGIPSMNMFPMGPIGMPMMATQMQMNNELKDESNENKINITFKTELGVVHTLVCDFGTTIDDMLKKYINEYSSLDYIKNDKVGFFYNATKLRLGDKTKIEDFFKSKTNPIVVINEPNNLIGG